MERVFVTGTASKARFESKGGEYWMEGTADFLELPR
jgi:hypothetical protein